MTGLDRIKGALAKAEIGGVPAVVDPGDLRAVVSALDTAMQLPGASVNSKATPFTRAEVLAMPPMGPMVLDMFKLLATVEAMEYWKWRCSDHELCRSRDLFAFAAQTRELEKLKADIAGLTKAIAAIGEESPETADLIKARQQVVRENCLKLIETAFDVGYNDRDGETKGNATFGKQFWMRELSKRLK